MLLVEWSVNKCGSMLEPTEFHEHITQNNACNEDIEDYNFTM